jgi:hypothetical protein
MHLILGVIEVTEKRLCDISALFPNYKHSFPFITPHSHPQTAPFCSFLPLFLVTPNTCVYVNGHDQQDVFGSSRCVYHKAVLYMLAPYMT